MVSRLNKGFSLIEVLVAIAILSTAIIFIFRSFVTLLSSQKVSQDLILATFLAEEKIWEVKEEQKKSLKPLDYKEGSQELQGNQFNWNCSFVDLGQPGLVELELNVLLPGKSNVDRRTVNLLTYIPSKTQ